MLAGLIFHLSWVVFAIVTLRLDKAYREQRKSPMQAI
jgi:hypothetical protein